MGWGVLALCLVCQARAGQGLLWWTKLFPTRHNHSRLGMAGQVYGNRASKCKQRKKEVTDVQAWYHSARRRTHPQSASSLGVLEKLEGEKLGTLRPCSSVPVSLVRIVAHKDGGPAVMQRFVALWKLPRPHRRAHPSWPRSEI